MKADVHKLCSLAAERGVVGGGHRGTVPSLECEILTLTRWALHGKNEVKSR